MDGWMDGRMDGRTGRQIEKRDGREREGGRGSNAWSETPPTRRERERDGRTDGEKERRRETDKQRDEETGRWKDR